MIVLKIPKSPGKNKMNFQWVSSLSGLLIYLFVLYGAAIKTDKAIPIFIYI